MDVVAFTSPLHSGWHWRIVKYSGEMIEESADAFSTIAAAVSTGTTRLRQLDVVDVTERPSVYRRWASRSSKGGRRAAG
jgi:hypothetical protein